MFLLYLCIAVLEINIFTIYVVVSIVVFIIFLILVVFSYCCQCLFLLLLLFYGCHCQCLFLCVVSPVVGPLTGISGVAIFLLIVLIKIVTVSIFLKFFYIVVNVLVFSSIVFV